MTSAEATPLKQPPFQLQAGEHVLRVCRRHFMFLYPKLALMTLVALLPPVVLLFAIGRWSDFGGAAGRVAWAASALWLVYWGVRIYFTWYKHEHDIWVITNQRLIDRQRPHWFKQRMASADLVHVEDIAIVREGLLPTAFNFGDVRCQTAGETPNFILAGIPEPDKVLALIDSARDASRQALVRPLGAI